MGWVYQAGPEEGECQGREAPPAVPGEAGAGAGRCWRRKGRVVVVVGSLTQWVEVLVNVATWTRLMIPVEVMAA